MMEGPIPMSYAEWHHCITVECGLRLTTSFIDERLAAMQNANDFRTKQFVELYGLQHHQNVLSWFQLAREKASESAEN